MSEQEDEAKSVALSRAIEMAVIETLDQLNVTDCDPQVIPILMEFVKRMCEDMLVDLSRLSESNDKHMIDGNDVSASQRLRRLNPVDSKTRLDWIKNSVASECNKRDFISQLASSSLNNIVPLSRYPMSSTSEEFRGSISMLDVSLAPINVVMPAGSEGMIEAAYLAPDQSTR